LEREALKTNFFNAVHQSLMADDIDEKIALLSEISERFEQGGYQLEPTAEVVRIPQPGHPEKPELVSPGKLAKRRLGSIEGRAALMHAITHIEFNAINLALDALYRFQEMPVGYYQDWLRVAVEEAYHFQMVREHLNGLGFQYGDFPAHNGLWQSTHETDHDVLVRMALVPRTLEARGLDVTPDMIQKLRAVGDKRAVEILKILLRDEIGHVAVGTRWFRYLCEQRNLNPFETFQSLLDAHFHGQFRGPFNYEARREAGFSEEELAWLKDREMG
jgi:uncharacterized ferritin-like protein (DUF455 family)